MLQRLLWRRRIFKIDIKTCEQCGGTVKVIACIQAPAVIEKIFTHLQEKVIPDQTDLLPYSRAASLRLIPPIKTA